VAARSAHLEAVAALATALDAAGFHPVLVGGMALILLGSRRVTMDFDLLVSQHANGMKDLMHLVYDHHLELVTKFNPEGEPLRTIDNARVAAARIQIDEPASVHLADRASGLRIDLLIDFPVRARELAERASRITVSTGSVRVASREDLIHLKEIAYRDRKKASDAQDLEFLRRLKK